VFPRAARLVTTLVETALGLTMLGGAISIVLTLATGASG
jgi:hypothetical protein